MSKQYALYTVVSNFRTSKSHLPTDVNTGLGVVRGVKIRNFVYVVTSLDRVVDLPRLAKVVHLLKLLIELAVSLPLLLQRIRHGTLLEIGPRRIRYLKTLAGWSRHLR